MERDSSPGFRQLHVFEVVSRLESISRASSELRLTQPTVTLAIANLEKAVDATLFERRPTGTYLTPYGRILQARALRLFEQMDAALVEFGVKRAEVAARRLTRSQMLCLNAIAQKNSLPQAAQAMGISRVMLHRIMRSFEDLLGSSLYRHTAFGVVVSRSAAELARRLMVAAREIEDAIDELQTMKGVVGSRIAIGAQILGSSSLIGSVSRKWIATYPNAYINIVSDGYSTLMQSLRTGEIDAMVGLLRRPPPFPDVREELLFLDPLVVVARKDHPLAGRRKLTPTQLARYPWVLTGARRSAFDRLFAGRSAAPPHVNLETLSLTVIRAILEESDHLTLLTQYEMQFEQRLGVLVPLRTDALVREVPAPIGITTRGNWLPTAQQAAFVQMMREDARSALDGA